MLIYRPADVDASPSAKRRVAPKDDFRDTDGACTDGACTERKPIYRPADVDASSSNRRPAASTGDIDLRELLSTCVDACRRGCEVIRNVRHRSLQNEDGDVEGVRYKVVDDPRSALTEADGASQKVIVECLNCSWEGKIKSGRIRIVGEEDEDQCSTDLEGERSFDTAYSEDITNHFDNYDCPRPDSVPMIGNMFGRAACGGEGAEKNGVREWGRRGDKIIIFIDPMDGTREFVEGRIHNVQCLIGITLNGRPVAGAMGLPMVHEDRIEVAYGLISPTTEEECDSSAVVPILSGVKFFNAVNPLDLQPAKNSFSCGDVGSSISDDDDGTLKVFSGDSKKPALKLAMHCLENEILGRVEPGEIQEADGQEGRLNPPFRKIIVGGCGNKFLSVQRHHQRLSERQEWRFQSAGCCTSYAGYLPSPFIGVDAHQSLPPPSVGAISMAPPRGSLSWDTAAPTAVLLAADSHARVTDLLGRPLVYDGKNLTNERGVLVSSGAFALNIHNRLCSRLRGDPGFCDAIGAGWNSNRPSRLSLKCLNEPHEHCPLPGYISLHTQTMGLKPSGNSLALWVSSVV